MNTETLLLISAAVSSASFTITFTSMFKWFREWVSPWHHKIEELVHCPWCFSHWVTFLVLGIVGDWFNFSGIGFVDFLLTSFAITLFSGLGHYVILRAYEPVAKAMAARTIQKLNS
jgi:hypothetical protein